MVLDTIDLSAELATHVSLSVRGSALLHDCARLHGLLSLHSLPVMLACMHFLSIVLSMTSMKPKD